jgi:hypothetical protein
MPDKTYYSARELLYCLNIITGYKYRSITADVNDNVVAHRIEQRLVDSDDCWKSTGQHNFSSFIGVKEFRNRNIAHDCLIEFDENLRVTHDNLDPLNGIAFENGLYMFIIRIVEQGTAPFPVFVHYSKKDKGFTETINAIPNYSSLRYDSKDNIILWEKEKESENFHGIQRKEMIVGAIFPLMKSLYFSQHWADNFADDSFFKKCLFDHTEIKPSGQTYDNNEEA